MFIGVIGFCALLSVSPPRMDYNDCYHVYVADRAEFATQDACWEASRITIARILNTQRHVVIQNLGTEQFGSVEYCYEPIN
jgi:hypothetical protein